MNLDTKNIHKLQMMFWKTYLLSKMPIVSVSLYIFFWGDPCKPIAWPFVHWGFSVLGGSEPHWLDKEKAEPSETAGVTGGSRAPKKQKRSGKSSATQKSAAARIRREKHGKKHGHVLFLVVSRILFLLFFGWGGRSSNIFFVKWCNVGDWAKLLLVDVLSQPPFWASLKVCQGKGHWSSELSWESALTQVSQ